MVGRFLQKDEYHGDGLNLYAYCGNNPVVYYDPSGYEGENCPGSKDSVDPEGNIGANTITDGKYNVKVHQTNQEVNTNGSKLKWGKEHGRGNTYHNNAIEVELDKAANNGATSIRKNQFQVDVNGNVVKLGTQRKPDSSYVINGKRYNTNYVSNYDLDNKASLNYELNAFLDMSKADPNAQNSLIFNYDKIKFENNGD